MGGKTPGHEDRLASPDDTALEVAQQRARRRAVRNVGSLTIANVDKVLTHERYWTRDFVDVYLDRCDQWIFEDPALANALAEHAPRLTERIRIGDRYDELPSVAERSSWRLRALSIRADTLRVLGEHDAAGDVLPEAYSFCYNEAVSFQALAELHRRRALRAAGNDRNQALAYLDEAVRLGVEAGELSRRGEAHLARAWLGMVPGQATGVADLAETLATSNPRRPRSKIVFGIALDRLWRVLARVPSLAVDEEPSALRSVHRAQRRFYGHTTKSVRKTLLYWTEALLTRRLGIERHTERRLRLARDNFAALGAEPEAFLIHLDMADLRENQQGDRRAALAALDSAEAFVGGDRRRAEILTSARKLLDWPFDFRMLRQEACDLLPVVPATDVLTPTPPREGRDRSILPRE